MSPRSGSLAAVLSEQAFFAGLDAESVEAVAKCGSNVRFGAGETLFRAGDEATALFAIRHGAVELERGRTLGPGELLGWPWLLHPYRWPFGARALSPVRATALDGACLRVRCEYDSRLGYRLMARFAQALFEEPSG